ncbi:MAG: hypothetical protein ISS18_15225 [Bacteroidales bacterium]|nr:hypothetical protein [Bacteroidales bacterium]
MKKLIILIFAAILIAGISCKKDEDVMGKIRVVNNDNEAYNIYLNGDFKTALDGNKYIIYTLLPGSYNIKAKEVDWLFYQNVYEDNCYLTAGGEELFSFGK